MIYSIKQICFGFAFIYVATYATYMFNCWYEEINIKEKEKYYKRFSNSRFYNEIFCMIVKYNPDYRRKNEHNAFHEAKKLYKEKLEFRIECYKKGLKPRLLQIIEHI